MGERERERGRRPARSSEESLQGQLLELETLYQGAPVGLCFLDRDLRFLRVNERLAAINGRSVEEHIGRTVDEMVPAIIDQVRPVYERVIDTGEPVRLEVRGELPSAPGTERIWLTHHHPVKAPDGGVTGIMTVVQDITELKRIQEELEHVKEHLSRAQQVAAVGSWEWDVIEDRVWWSEELFRIFHRDPGSFEASLNGVFDLMLPEDRPKIREQLDATLERDEPYESEFRIELPDGSVRVIEARASLDRTPDGTPKRLIGTARDVTDSRRNRSG